MRRLFSPLALLPPPATPRARPGVDAAPPSVDAGDAPLAHPPCRARAPPRQRRGDEPPRAFRAASPLRRALPGGRRLACIGKMTPAATSAPSTGSWHLRPPSREEDATNTLGRIPFGESRGAGLQRLRWEFAALLAVGALVAALAAAMPAAADYGTGAVYEVEISANLGGPNGGGVWLWIELDANGTGDYHGADCGHAQGPAASDGGDVTWTVSNGMLVISGVHLNGLPPFLQPPAITVPATYGHYSYRSGNPFGTIFGLPFPGGFAQVQIAP